MNNKEAPSVLVTGDSHVAFAGDPNSRVSDNLESQFMIKKKLTLSCSYIRINFIYLGPQLAFNLSENDLNERCKTFFSNNTILALFLLGEIDIRVHLANKKNEKSVVETYLNTCLNFARNNNVSLRFILPPAPTDFGFHDPTFPKNGSLEKRLTSHFLFCLHMRKLCTKLGLMEPISIKNYYGRRMTKPLTTVESDDGCHLNTKMNIKLQKKIVKVSKKISYSTRYSKQKG